MSVFTLLVGIFCYLPRSLTTQRFIMYTAVEKISAVLKQVQRNITDNSCFLITVSSTFPLSLVCIVLSLMSSHCLPASFALRIVFLSPSQLLSSDIKLWLSCKCIQHSSIIHCSKLPRLSLLFFPLPLCGCRPISSVHIISLDSFDIVPSNLKQTLILQER